MPAIQTIARPSNNKVSVAIPPEYAACTFRVTLVPIPLSSPSRSKPSDFVDALLSCPKFGDDGIDLTNDNSDCGREIDL